MHLPDEKIKKLVLAANSIREDIIKMLVEAGSGHSAGPLGMAYGLRMDGKKNWVFCLMSDGEHEEGNTWEAVMFAGKNKLANLIAIMDRNNIQIDGFTEEIMPLESVRAKYEAFNWHVIEINGHDFAEIINAIEEAKAIENKPVMVIAHTIPGKGVDFMENKFEWHGKPPNPDEAKKALTELRTLQGKIRSEH